MAKLGSYYGLCPLIDHKSLLGVTEGEESGLVIVTLGKNIAIKYKVADQKQLCSWRTKDKFTSPVIFDKESSRCVAVFNKTYIRRWSGEEEFLDKLKKLKFNQPIHTLFTCNNKSFIVFNNGSVDDLNEAIANRKQQVEEDVIDISSESIEEALHISSNDDFYIGLITKAGEDCSLHWTKFKKERKFHKVPLKREGVELTGYCFHSTGTLVHFLSLWSDGKVLSYPLDDSETMAPGDLFTVIETINCRHYVSMMSLDEDYLAMYGGDCNEEGAMVAIYNAQFKVTQSRQALKLFTKGAKVWRIDKNLFLPVGRNLAVVPFFLDTEQLAALVGSHKPLLDSDISIVQTLQVADWGLTSKPSLDTDKEEIPECLRSKLEDLASQGLPESVIFEHVLADFMEQRDLGLLQECIRYFSDIPEKYLAKLLKLFLNLDVKLLKNQTKFYSPMFPEKLQPIGRLNLVNSVLAKPFSDVLLLPHVHSSLTLDDVLILLEYFSFLLSEEYPLIFPSEDFVKTEEPLIKWGCLLLDSNFQRFLLSKDPKVKEVVSQFNDAVTKELSNFEEYNEMVVVLDECLKGTAGQSSEMRNLHYSIEHLSLY